MANMTDYLERKLINHVLCNSAYTPPATVYIALFTADPTDTGNLANEVSTAGDTLYARQPVAFKALTTETTGQTSNSAQVEFPEAGASWGTVTHIGLMDSDVAGAGNMLFHGALEKARQADVGTQLIFKVGQLTVMLA
jgi:hypothetical protein